MVNSIGKNIIKDLSKYSDNKSKDPIQTAYDLQVRLSHWYQSNPAQVLLNSKKYSGEYENGMKSPLGGDINIHANNTTNAPSQNVDETAFYSEEFPFWDFNCDKSIEQPVKKEIKQEQEIKENFSNKKENFSGITGILSITGIIMLIVIFIIGLLFVYDSFRNN